MFCAKESTGNYTMASRFSGGGGARTPPDRGERRRILVARGQERRPAVIASAGSTFRGRAQRMDNSPIKSNLTRTEYKLGDDTFCG